ncbi:MAG: hypothetical protein JXA20_04325 [Spirochaetes bacterium]|nr:hypothetical protein [Spirochaetota bacterium]
MKGTFTAEKNRIIDAWMARLFPAGFPPVCGDRFANPSASMAREDLERIFDWAVCGDCRESVRAAVEEIARLFLLYRDAPGGAVDIVGDLRELSGAMSDRGAPCPPGFRERVDSLETMGNRAAVASRALLERIRNADRARLVPRNRKEAGR